MAVLRGFIPAQVLEAAAMANPAVALAAIVEGNTAADYWRSLPPATGGVDEEALHGKQRTGAYRDSIRVDVDRKATHLRVRVSTDHPLAWAIEHGSKHMPQYAPMAKTMAYMASRPGVHSFGSLD